MRTLPQDEPSIAEQAARWLGVLEHGTEREHTAFATWLRASPQHVREFLLLTAMEKEVGELDLEDFDVADILRSANANVVRLEAKENPLTLAAPAPAALVHPCASTLSPNGERGRRGWGIAAAIALAAVGSWWMWVGPGAWQSYATAIGEQRAFELEDGSIVELNPLSRIRVKSSGAARDIELRSGEALFKVEHDPARPFRVYSGDTVVRAVGTQFTVHRRTGSVTVSVIEGKVEVSREEEALPLPSPILAAGEEIKIVAGERAVARRAADAVPTNTWRERSLTFSGDSLADIAEDFNRYNRTPQIHIEGDALRARQFSGVFNVDDPASLIAYLSQDERLAFERRDGVIVIKER